MLRRVHLALALLGPAGRARPALALSVPTRRGRQARARQPRCSTVRDWGGDDDDLLSCLRSRRLTSVCARGAHPLARRPCLRPAGLDITPSVPPDRAMTARVRRGRRRQPLAGWDVVARRHRRSRSPRSTWSRWAAPSSSSPSRSRLRAPPRLRPAARRPPARRTIEATTTTAMATANDDRAAPRRPGRGGGAAVLFGGLSASGGLLPWFSQRRLRGGEAGSAW